MTEEIQLRESDQKLMLAVDSCIMAREHKSHVIQALELARGVTQLKQVLAMPEVYTGIESLMNDHIGFVTDKNPAKMIQNKKTGDWEPTKPYPKEVVISCVAEALSLGLYLHNNEFNIISGRCYPAQAGFKRMLSDFKKKTGTQTEVIPGVPQKSGPGYLCTCKVAWTLQGKPREERELSWNISAFSSDAALGKVSKRAHQWLFNELTENNWSSELDYLDEGESDPVKIEPHADDIEPAKLQGPSLGVIVEAFKAAPDLAALEAKKKKADSTEHAKDPKMIKAYEARKAELSK
jgi:hypothetical protein